MSGRPGDWDLVDRDSDPVSGDPDAVADEAKHYKGVAEEIEEQVARLRRLAHPDESLKGDYTKALQDSCEELADHMERAHGRFETAGEQLARLVTPLETAQTDTMAALNAAVTAAGNEKDADGEGYSALEMLDADNIQAQAARKKLSDVRDDLDRAKKDCDDAVDAYDRVARDVAKKIKDASDDDMKDGRFEGLKSWVKDHADMLREISKWLGRIVFVLALAIILLSNPAGWLLIAAVLAAGALLVVDTMLASAGEGSWTNVAFDAVGLLTFGAGSLAGKVARFGRSMTLFKAGNAQGLKAANSSLRSAFTGSGLVGRVSGFTNRFRPGTYDDAIRSYRETLRTVKSTPMQNAPGLQRFEFPFSHEVANLKWDRAELVRTYGPDSITGLHNAGVSMVKSIASVETVASGTDLLLEMPVPGIQDLNKSLDGMMTRELSPLW